MNELSTEWVWNWSQKYAVENDDLYYMPYIEAGRQGDVEAIEALTRWKNSNRAGRPMDFSAKKRAAVDYFLSRLELYFQPGGEAQLREDFRYRAPVWSIFWCHILFGSPILDRYTYTAFECLKNGIRLSRSEAYITCPHHWDKLDNYRGWFEPQLDELSKADASISDRVLDRALMMYGEWLSKTL